jgi:hypothetical protein
VKKTKEASTIGNALAGHSFRDAKHPKAKEYDNPLTDYMNLMLYEIHPIGETMKILIACEESQAVTISMRAKGHEAYSCDILPCSGGHPEWHLQQDVTELLKEHWDMIIAFPPCTHLAVSGARHFEQKIRDGRQQQGIDFFMLFANAKCERIAIENPVGIMSSKWRKPDQIIQPFEYGDPFKKTTCLWLKGLPKLEPTNIVNEGEFIEFISKKGVKKKQPKWYFDALKLTPSERAKLRSKTFPGIAQAMTDQWG